VIENKKAIGPAYQIVFGTYKSIIFKTSLIGTFNSRYFVIFINKSTRFKIIAINTSDTRKTPTNFLSK
jgi:hypothetical protein